MNRRLAHDLAVSSARAVRWTVPLAAYGLVLLVLVWRRADLAQPGSALPVVRTVGVLLVLGVLPLLDDPATRQAAAAPLPLRTREAPRLLAMTVLVLLPFAALAVATGLPFGAVLLETAAILAVAEAAALLLRRLTDQAEPSPLVSIGVLVLPMAIYLLPGRIALYVGPGPLWTEAHVRWSVLAGLGIFGVAVALRDPASRPFTRLGRLSSEPGERVASGPATRR